MASVTKIMTVSEIDDLYRRIKPHMKKQNSVPYALWSAKVSGTTITAYKSGKVLFQGNDLSWLEDDKGTSSSGSGSKKGLKTGSSLKDQVPSAGSDEVGTGDYFGPLTVASVLVETMEQAEARCGGKLGNKGDECAITAIKMIDFAWSFQK
ncbi:MAG: DUF3378 domain-containing protein [Erysipelotrichaceae bacterium]|nr:DUF3378 domain-containing protein [Erysipelotrichaceae bacterium]